MRLKDVTPDDTLYLEMLLSQLAINLENHKFFSDGLGNNIAEKEEILKKLEALIARSQK